MPQPGRFKPRAALRNDWCGSRRSILICPMSHPTPHSCTSYLRGLRSGRTRGRWLTPPTQTHC
jgi:hypothetical protein